MGIELTEEQQKLCKGASPSVSPAQSSARRLWSFVHRFTSKFARCYKRNIGGKRLQRLPHVMPRPGWTKRHDQSWGNLHGRFHHSG
jgi:hypothetical protein